MTDPERTIAGLVHELNEAWIDGRYDDIAKFYDPAVVVRAPEEDEPVVGVDAIVASYRGFMSEVELEGFEARELSVDLLGDTAVARLLFTVRYSVEGELLEEHGVDLMVWQRRDDRWRITWRTQFTEIEDEELNEDDDLE
jgi:ketosteroid isomerase-like protein